MAYEKDRGEFVEVLRHEGVPEDVALSVLRDTQRIQTLSEHQCGDGTGSGPYGEPTEAEMARWEKSEELAQARIGGRLAAYGIVSNFQGDPRGAVVRLRLPSGRSNDFAGEGYYCVPTRY